MAYTTKIILIVGAVLVALGLIVCAVVMVAVQGDFSKLSTLRFVSNTHAIADVFSRICIQSGTADILFGVSDDNTCKVICYEQENALHQVFVQDGVLNVRLQDQRKWYEHFGISGEHPQITLYLPKEAYASVTVDAGTGDVALPRELTFDNMEISLTTGNISCFASVTETATIRTHTGNIWVESSCAETLNLSVTTGQVAVSHVACSGDVTVDVTTGLTRLSDMTCRTLSSTGTTGDLTLTDVVAVECFSLVRSTGDIHFSKCDAGEITAKTSTGTIEGTLRTPKVFITKTSSGGVDVPKTITGGRCELTTTTGNICIQIEE